MVCDVITAAQRNQFSRMIEIVSAMSIYTRFIGDKQTYFGHTDHFVIYVHISYQNTHKIRANVCVRELKLRYLYPTCYCWPTELRIRMKIIGPRVVEATAEN